MRKYRRNPQFWGKAGSGIMFLAQDDTVLLTLRSPWVMQPDKWGIPGGAVRGTEGFHDSKGTKFKFTFRQAWQSAKRETEEELGYFPKVFEIIGDTVFEQDNFAFVTFIVLVKADEKKQMNLKIKLDEHEATAFKWFPMSRLVNWKNDPELAGDLHFGVQFTVEMIKRP